MNIAPIAASLAVEFVSARHYTGSASPGTNRFGLYRDGELVGVSIYNNGTHAMCSGVFGPGQRKSVIHHHRLALEPGLPRGTASEFLGHCMRALAAIPDGPLAIVTYADACQGHVGTIYQATNGIYTGITCKGNLKFRTRDGVIVPTQSLSGTWPERREKAAELGWEEVRCKGKHRYVHLLGSGAQKKWLQKKLLWPQLPYPKADQ